MPEKSIRIDALRGAAILAIIQFHYASDFGLYAWVGAPGSVQAILSYGWAGVDLFFVLSAFLLTRNLLSHRGEAGVIGVFYRRRILRILPLYVLLAAMAAALIPILGTEKGQAGEWLLGGLAPFWSYGLFLQNFWSGLQPVWSGHFLAPTWSLAVEEHFYLVLPFLILRQNDRRIALLSLAFLVAGPLVRFALVAGVGSIAAQSWSIARADSFGWGILLALAFSHGPTGRESIRKFWVGAASVVTMTLCVYSAIGGLEITNRNPLIFSAAAVLAARLALSAASPSDSQPARDGVLLRALAWMGERCYSLYLLHMPIVGSIFMAIGQTAPQVIDTTSFIAVVAAAAILGVLADLSYRFVERPFIDYGRRNARYPEGAPIVASA